MYTKLPPIEQKELKLIHFPSKFHCAVFRFWETVREDVIAKALETDAATVRKAASDMGLPKQKYNENWKTRGYITTIRNAWHILPYDQLLVLLEMSEDELALILKEDDFLRHKLGDFKPFCERVVPTELDDAQFEQLAAIKAAMEENFGGLFDGEKPFDFFFDCKENVKSGDAPAACENLRLIYSYCGLYAGVLDNDISLSYPEKLLEMYSEAGVNAVWLQAVLYQLVPFPFDENVSKGYEKRLERLRQLTALAAKYGIKVFLYINEPRCMPLSLFDKYPELKGRVRKGQASLCMSDKRVTEYLRTGIRTLCEAVPDIGGFFTITCSENLTHCKSRSDGEACERCKDTPIYELISDVVCAVSEESRKVNPNIKTICWSWSWESYMTADEIKKCIDLIPKEVIIQSNSEAYKEFCIGGVCGKVRDYSMSIPGPSEKAMELWNYAVSKGHEICAKVQVNDTWECSTVTYLPVFDLIREHMTNLKNAGVEHLMLSWTLGGYPSINLKIASSCLENPSEENYDELLKKEYGKDWKTVKTAAKHFSQAFCEFPFDIHCLYEGPQNSGPSNLLYDKPTDFKATMTCYPYDDLDGWRSIYPGDVYINQLRLLCEKWRTGLKVLENMSDCSFVQMAYAGYALFYSSYLQSEFVDKREKGDKTYLSYLVSEERKLALMMYELMSKNPLIGYEAANHYYFNKGMLAEKIVNCDCLLEKYRK